MQLYWQLQVAVQITLVMDARTTGSLTTSHSRNGRHNRLVPSDVRYSDAPQTGRDVVMPLGGAVVVGGDVVS